MALRRPIIHGLFEVDVTDVRAILRRASEAGPLSLSAYLLWCLGRTLGDHPRVHGYRHRGHLVVFDEVDATLIVESEEGGFSFPRAHVFRDIGDRTVIDLHRELRSLQAVTDDDTAEQVRRMRWLLRLPAVLRRAVYRAYLSDPRRRKRLMGTVAVTAVGMHSERGFWGIALPQHTLQIVVGGVAKRPQLIGGRVVERDMLAVTVAVDHDVVDGAPAVRFADDLASAIEDADALRRHLGMAADDAIPV